MKNLFLMMIMVIFMTSIAIANTTPVPFAYDQTIEWSKLDAKMQKDLLAYANAGTYNTPVEIKADSVLQTTLVKGVKSRSGKTEDQVWLQIQEGGKVVNYLFSLSALPVITADATGKLSISAHRGNSNNQGLIRNPW